MKFNFSLIYCRIQWRIETKGNFGLNWVDFIDFANRWSQLWGFEEHSSSVSGIGSIGGSGSIHVSDCLLRQLLLILLSRRGLLLLVIINSLSTYLSTYLSIYLSNLSLSSRWLPRFLINTNWVQNFLIQYIFNARNFGG